MNRFLTGVVFLLLSLSTASHWSDEVSAQVQTTVQSASPRSPEDPLKALLEKAQAGDPVSQQLIGALAYDTKNYDAAMNWAQKVIANPAAPPFAVGGAEFIIGQLYAFGRGVAQDQPEAVKWLRRSADKGNSMGQVALGTCYDQGTGIAQDFAEAAKWFRMAAQQNDADGQAHLAAQYTLGHGVPLDLIEAHKWINIAASHSGATQTKYVEFRDAIAKQLTPPQLADAQIRAREWLESFNARKKSSLSTTRSL